MSSRLADAEEHLHDAGDAGAAERGGRAAELERLPADLRREGREPEGECEDVA